MTLEAMESAMVVACYAALGQSVTYVGQAADSATIYAIVDDGSDLLGLESVTAEESARARVKASDVATPRRGDRIEMASGKVYMVDGVERANNVEWLLSMTERDK